MALIYRYNGQTTQGVTDGALPGSAGFGDVGSAITGQWAALYNNILFDTYAMSGRTVPMLRFRDASAGGEPQWDIGFGAQPDKTALTQLSGAYSMRFYYRQSSTASTVTQPIMQFRLGSTVQWELASVEQTRPTVPGLTAAVTAMTPATGMFRFEVQVDPARTTKVIIRIYVEDSDTVYRSLAVSPAATTIDRVRIGHYTSGNYSPSEVQYADIEIHDDYDLGGQFTSNPSGTTPASTSATGVPASTPAVDGVYNYDATTNRTLPAATLTEGTHYTKATYTYVTGTPTYNRVLDLYKPIGTAPSGGWPVIVWAHSGFFYSGTRADLPSNWRDDLLNAGYAVASVEYVRTSAVVSPLTYDAYGSTAEFRGGRYPSMILDFKRAGAYLRDNASTLGLNGSKMIAAGYSAGGYIALAAAVTENVATDAAGNKLSLAAAAAVTPTPPEWADNYTGADPSFRGVIAYHPPTDLDKTATWDPTFPNASGTVNAAYRSFQGLTWNAVVNTSAAPSAPHTTIRGLMNRKSALSMPDTFPPIWAEFGEPDYLVHWENFTELQAAVGTDRVVDNCSVFQGLKNHDRANLIYVAADLVDATYGVIPTVMLTDPNRAVTTTAPGVATAAGDPTETVVQSRSTTTTAPGAVAVTGSPTIIRVQNRTVTTTAPAVQAFTGTASVGVVQDRVVTTTAVAIAAAAGNPTEAVVQNRAVTSSSPTTAANTGTATVAIVQNRSTTTTAPAVAAATGTATVAVVQNRSITTTAATTAAACGTPSVTTDSSTPGAVTTTAPTATATTGTATVAVVQDRAATTTAPAVAAAAGDPTEAVVQNRAVTTTAPPVAATPAAATVAVVQDRAVTVTAPTLAAGCGTASVSVAAPGAVTTTAPAVNAAPGTPTVQVVQNAATTTTAPTVAAAVAAATVAVVQNRAVTTTAPAATATAVTAGASTASPGAVSPTGPSIGAGVGLVSVTITQNKSVTTTAPSFSITAGVATASDRAPTIRLFWRDGTTEVVLTLVYWTGTASEAVTLEEVLA